MLTRIQAYQDFNASNGARVRPIQPQMEAIGGLCTYVKGNWTAFLLPKACWSYVQQGYKWMFVNRQFYKIEAGEAIYLPQHALIFTAIPEQALPFQSCNWWAEEEVGTIPQHLKDEQLLKIVTQSLKDKTLTKQSLNARRNPQPDTKLLYSLLPYIFEPVTLGDLADLSYLSLATFKRHFKAYTGLAPKTWIRAARLQTAYFNLQFFEAPITEIAYWAAYENIAHFSYAFKHYFNCRPSEVRKLNNLNLS